MSAGKTENFVNHYSVLGLHPSGQFNELPYGIREITDQYKKLARKVHPSRNPAPEAEGKFILLFQSFAILKDVKQRDLFDAELQERPEEYTNSIERQDLYADMDGVNTPDIPYDDNPHAGASSINLSALFAKAGTSVEEKLALARQHVNIAMGFVDNNDLFATFSARDQFRLLLILVSCHRIDNHRLHSKLNLFFTVHNRKKIEGMLGVCKEEPGFAQDFFATYPQYLDNLDLDDLINLSNHYKEAAIVLTQKHTKHFSYFFLQRLCKKYELPAVVQSDADANKLFYNFKAVQSNQAVDLALMVRMVAVLGTEIWSYCNKDICQYLLAIQAIIEIDKTYDYFRADVRQDLSTTVASSSSQDAPAMSLSMPTQIRPLSARDISFLVDRITSLPNANLTPALLNNLSFFEKILQRATSYQIQRFFLNLPCLYGMPCALFYNDVLQSIPDGRNSLVQLITGRYSIPFLEKNQNLFDIIFSDPHYLNEMEQGNNHFRYRIGRWVGKYKLTVDVENLRGLHPQTAQCIRAYQGFFDDYLTPNTEINEDQFESLFKHSYFFPEMIFLKSKGVNIPFKIVMTAQPIQTQWGNPDTRSKVSELFYRVMISGTSEQREQLLDAYKDRPLPSIVNLLDYGTDIFKRGLPLLPILAAHPQWARAITGNLLNKWEQHKSLICHLAAPKAHVASYRAIFESETYRSKINAFNDLQQQLNALKTRNITLSSQEFSRLRDLLMQCGLDTQTQECLVNTLSIQNYELLMYLIETTAIPCHPDYTRVVTSQSAAISLAKQSLLAARHYLERNHKHIQVSVLDELYRIHQEAVQDLVDTYDLQQKLDSNYLLQQFRVQLETNKQIYLFSATPKDDDIHDFLSAFVALLSLDSNMPAFAVAYQKFQIKLGDFCGRNGDEFPVLQITQRFFKQKTLTPQEVLDACMFALFHAPQACYAKSKLDLVLLLNPSRYLGLFQVLFKMAVPYRGLMNIFDEAHVWNAVSVHLQTFNLEPQKDSFVCGYVMALLNSAQWAIQDITRERVDHLKILESKLSVVPSIAAIPPTRQLFELKADRVALLPLVRNEYTAEEINQLSTSGQRVLVAYLIAMGERPLDLNSSDYIKIQTICSDLAIAQLDHFPEEVFSKFVNVLLRLLPDTGQDTLLTDTYMEMVTQSELNENESQALAQVDLDRFIHSGLDVSEQKASLARSTSFPLAKISRFFGEPTAKLVLAETINAAILAHDASVMQSRRVSDYPILIAQYLVIKELAYSQVFELFGDDVASIVSAFIKSRLNDAENSSAFADYIFYHLSRDALTWSELDSLNLNVLKRFVETMPAGEAIPLPRALATLSEDNMSLALLLNYGFTAADIQNVFQGHFRNACIKICQKSEDFKSHQVHPLHKAQHFFVSDYRKNMSRHISKNIYDILVTQNDLSTLILEIHRFASTGYLTDSQLPLLFPNAFLGIADAKTRVVAWLALNVQVASTIVSSFSQDVAIAVAEQLPAQSVTVYLGSGLDPENTQKAWKRVIAKTIGDASLAPTPFQIQYLYDLLSARRLSWLEINDIVRSDKYAYLVQLEQVQNGITFSALNSLPATRDLFLLDDLDSIPLLLLQNERFTIDSINHLPLFLKKLGVAYLEQGGYPSNLFIAAQTKVFTALCMTPYFAYLATTFSSSSPTLSDIISDTALKEIVRTIREVFSTTLLVNIHLMPVKIHITLFNRASNSVKSMLFDKFPCPASHFMWDNWQENPSAFAGLFDPFDERLSLQDLTQIFGEEIVAVMAELSTIKRQVNQADIDETRQVISAWQTRINVSTFLALSSTQIHLLALIQRAFVPEYLRTILTDLQQDLFRLHASHIPLLPLLDHNYMSVDAINRIEPNSLAFSLYGKFISDSMQDSGSKEQLNQLARFCGSAYYQFLSNEILTPIQQELQIWRQRQLATPSVLNQEKVRIMELYLHEIKQNMVQKICAQTRNHTDLNRVVEAVHTGLQDQFTTIVNDPILKKQHKPILAFFLKILGAIIATCCLFIPLLSKSFRQTFFADPVEIQKMKLFQAKIAGIDENLRRMVPG